MGKYFGTDGFRGEANVTLTVEDAYKVGRFLGWYYGQKTKADRCRVVIGKDTRRSSYMFEYSLVSGLTASGADVYLLHVTTTPSVSYVVRTEEFDCGIMISASHNPYYDNGIKVINGRGEKLEEETIEKIESYLDGEMGEIPFAKRDAIGRTVDYAAGRNRYIGYLISLATRSFKNMRVGLDCANGSASAIAKNVFDALGAETHVINNTPDGLNINTNCGSTHIEGLQKYVVENHLDVGFAYDGDADRCLAVDSEGKLVDGDKILYVCGKYMKEQGTLVNNTVVTTVMSNFGLYKAFEREGISYEKTAVGDKYVYENMSQNGHCLGGEQSGHIIFSKHATTGDGILTSLKLMEVILEKKETLAKLADEVQIYPQVLKNVRVKDKEAAQADRDVQAEVQKVSDALGDTGRILVRPSGTEPLIRVMVEAPTDEICGKYVAQVVEMIEKKGLAEEDMREQLTESDVKKIQEEIDHRKLVVRKEAIEAVKEARAQGDLSENFEYYAAKKDKNRNESRIRYLENMLKHAKIVSEESRPDEVGMNDTVTLYFEDDDEEDVYRLVTSIRGNSLENRISIESPLGKAIEGHHVGDQVEVKVNDKSSYVVEIRKIEKTGEEDSDRIRSY